MTLAAMTFATADVCDAHDEGVAVAEPLFRDYGGARRFAGEIATVKTFEDNAVVRIALEQPGGGRVLVVDGGGSTRCALLGDRLAELARSNGWAGVVVNGAVRDVEALASLPIGVKALASCPRRSAKAGTGVAGIEVEFAGVTFRPGGWLYADADGIVVARAELA